jgi:beta-galactosidase
MMATVNDYVLSTKPKKADVAILFSDEARAYFECEMIEGYDYVREIHKFYEGVTANGVYRDIVYESSDLSGYKVLFIPFLPYVSDSVYQKIVNAVESGSTVVVGPFTGTRTVDHTIHTDNALSKLERYMGVNVEDIVSFNNQGAVLQAFDKEYPLKSTSIVVEADGNEIGVIKGGYSAGKSVLWQKQIGKGKVVLLGSLFEKDALAEITAQFMDEKVDKTVRSTTDVAFYKRVDENGKTSYCFVNMCGEERTVTVAGINYFTKQKVDGKLSIEPYGYVVIEE